MKSIGLSSELFIKANRYLAHDTMFDRQDSACSLQWTIQMKDKQIAVISEKLNSHLALFNSVGKEVASVTQVLADVECLVGEKESVGTNANGTLLVSILFDQSSALLVH